MKIPVITSRYTATRDIISDDFGRQTRLFAAFKKLGNHVNFFCADYRKFENVDLVLHGINVSIRAFSILNFLKFLKEFNKKMQKERYDFVIATSDPLWGIIGYYFTKKYHTKFVYDLHDNYETYATYNIPLFRFFDRHVLKNSDIITTVSFNLKDKISATRKNDIFVIQNGYDDKLFRPLDKAKCRKELKLDKNSKIIAYAGSIQRAQGMEILIDAFKQLKNDIKNLQLVIAGKFYGNEQKYINLKQKGIIFLGSITQHRVAKLINSADVVVVPNSLNDFTKYCFPYKVVEYMACNVPIVATDVGDVGILLKNFKTSLCRPDDSKDMKNKIKLQLNAKKIDYRKSAINNTWGSIAKKLEKILKNYNYNLK